MLGYVVYFGYMHSMAVVAVVVHAATSGAVPRRGVRCVGGYLSCSQPRLWKRVYCRPAMAMRWDLTKSRLVC